eukprot:12274-Chlamydomonas_euryale.AAC.5
MKEAQAATFWWGAPAGDAQGMPMHHALGLRTPGALGRTAAHPGVETTSKICTGLLWAAILCQGTSPICCR